MGRPRTPNAVKIAEGTRKDRINRLEPTSPPGLGPPPDWLGDDAAEKWAELDALLAPMKVATRADRELATLYCQTYRHWRAAIGEVEADGLTFTESRSEFSEITKANVLLPTVLGLQKQMADILKQFGMTPVARAALTVEPPIKEDPLLTFVKGRNGSTRQKQSQKASR